MLIKKGPHPTGVQTPTRPWLPVGLRPPDAVLTRSLLDSSPAQFPDPFSRVPCAFCSRVVAYVPVVKVQRASKQAEFMFTDGRRKDKSQHWQIYSDRMSVSYVLLFNKIPHLAPVLFVDVIIQFVLALMAWEGNIFAAQCRKVFTSNTCQPAELWTGETFILNLIFNINNLVVICCRVCHLKA